MKKIQLRKNIQKLPMIKKMNKIDDQNTITGHLTELRSRLIQRGHDSNEKIEERLKNAEIELTHAEIFDYIVLNDDFDRALKELSTIIFNGKIEIDSEKNLNLLSELLDKSTN